VRPRVSIGSRISDSLADRTNGRAYVTVLRLSSSLYGTESIVAKRCVLEQKLLLTEVVYEKLIGTKMNDLVLCLEVVSRSCHSVTVNHCATFDVEYLGNRYR